jgi:hypothetical protein
MDRENIIRMAHEAGLHLATDVNWMPIIGLEYAEKFAKLVAAKEREACAKLCETIGNTQANMNAAWRNGCRDAAIEIRAKGEQA